VTTLLTVTGFAFMSRLTQIAPPSRSLLKKAAGPGVFAGFAFDELG
jgi:hypothetical protein